jgi:hypothetical protein
MDCLRFVFQVERIDRLSEGLRARASIKPVICGASRNIVIIGLNFEIRSFRRCYGARMKTESCPSEIHKGNQRHCTALLTNSSPPALPSLERADRNRRPLSDRCELGPVRDQRPAQLRFSRRLLAGKDNRRGFQWKTALPADDPHFTPLSLRRRVGGRGQGNGSAKRESLGRAGGLQSGVLPRRSADDRSILLASVCAALT